MSSPLWYIGLGVVSVLIWKVLFFVGYCVTWATLDVIDTYQNRRKDINTFTLVKGLMRLFFVRVYETARDRLRGLRRRR